MLTDAALQRHLKAAHADFGERDLFTDAGERVEGFFITRTALGEENRVPENIRYFRSPSRLAINARITDRKKAASWRVKNIEGEDGAFIHTMEAAIAA